MSACSPMWPPYSAPAALLLLRHDAAPPAGEPVGPLKSAMITEVDPLARRRALFFFPGCFIGRTDGCHTRATQTLDLLIASGLEVVIYAYRWHPIWPWSVAAEQACALRFPGARLVLERNGQAMRLVGRAKSALSLIGPRARRSALTSRVPGLTPGFDMLKSERPFDIVVVSYAAGLTQINGLPASAKVIVDTHDVTSLGKVRASPSGLLDFGAMVSLRKEFSLLAMADVIWSISFAETIFLKEMLDSSRIRFVPPVAPLGMARPRHTSQFDLLFVASDTIGNVDALLEFLKDFAGWQTRFGIGVAGKVSLNPRVRECAQRITGVKLLGFQDDLAALYQRTRAAICPTEGTGTKIKVIEALTAGRPVFAAPGASRGLAPGYEGCVFGLDERSVVSVLGNPSALQNAEEGARAYSARYTFDTVLQTVKADLG